MTKCNIDLLNSKDLLKCPINKLGLNFNSLPHKQEIKRLQNNLRKRKINFNPLIWLSDEWYCPEGKSSIAIPFTLIHPRLIELEKKYLGHCEGENSEEFYKLLVHECGHAIDHAFKFNKDPERINVFGDSSKKYPQYYLPKPYSKNFVINLKNNYAQSHPDEDFAETFSVWLQDKKHWQNKYANWPALKKLEYIESLIKSIRNNPALINTKNKVLCASKDSRTLGEYFQWKRKSFNVQGSRFYKNKISNSLSTSNIKKANLKSYENEICQSIANKTRIKKYIVKSMLKELEKEMNIKKVILNESTSQKIIEKIIFENSSEFIEKNAHRIIM